MSEVDLCARPAVHEAFAAARPKLAGYRQTLCEIYGEKLRLPTYVVVAVGFECLVWEEIEGQCKDFCLAF